MILAALLCASTVAAPALTLTGSLSIVQGTFDGTYSPSVNPQTIMVNTPSGVRTLSHMILPSPGSYANGTACSFILPDSVPLAGSYHNLVATFTLLDGIKGQPGGVTIPIPLSTSGAMQEGLYVGASPYNNNIKILLPAVSAAGVDFANGVVCRWDVLPTSYSVGFSGGAGDIGQLTIVQPISATPFLNRPITVDMRATGTSAGASNGPFTYECFGEGMGNTIALTSAVSTANATLSSLATAFEFSIQPDHTLSPP